MSRGAARPVVVASLNDADAQRCVDILRFADGQFGWTECRRDPEDGHGWRPLGPPVTGFADAAAARAAAAAAVGWLAEGAT